MNSPRPVQVDREQIGIQLTPAMLQTYLRNVSTGPDSMHSASR